MRVFLISCLAVVVLALGALLTLYPLQKRASEKAVTTEGARISPTWSARQIFSKPKAAPKTVAMAMPTSEGMADEECASSAWTMILADFSSSPTDEPACEY
jgi:hypothetical protein